MARLIDIIFDLILLIVVARMLVAAFRRFLGSATTRSSQPGPASWQQDKRETVHGETARDPVCGMFVSTELSFRRFLGSATTRSSQPGPASWQQDKRETVHGETARDPVCGMFVSTELSHRLEWHGKLLHFCSEECLNQYRKSASA